MTTTTPKSMRNSIWTRPEVKKTSKHWSYRPHRRSKLVTIALVKNDGGTFIVNGQPVDSFDAVKSHAKEQGFDQIRMGAVKVNLK